MRRTFGWGVLVACLIVKVGILLLDDRVRVFLGDSSTYLWSAISLDIPADRSYVYPLLIRATAGMSGSIMTLLWLQTLCGVATSMMIYGILRRAFAVSLWASAGAALLVALDPSQLFYERMVMTESVSTCVLVATLYAAFAYLRCRQIRYLALCIGLGLLLASLRAALVPFALTIGPVTVLLAYRNESIRACARALLLAIVATWACHSAYQHAYGSLTHSRPGYIHYAGFFRLGLVAPLVTPASFDGTGLDPSLLEEVKIPLYDPRSREAQIWHAGGLIDVLNQHAGPRAYRIANQVATNAIKNDPVGVVRLGLQTLGEYFNGAYYHERLMSDLGADRRTDEVTLERLKTRFSYDATGVAQTPSPVFNYFAETSEWLVCCLFSLLPLSMLVIVLCRRRHTNEGILLGLVGIGLVVGHTLCSHIISFRYLHPFPMLEIVSIAVVVNAIVAARSRQPNETSAYSALRAGVQTP